MPLALDCARRVPMSAWIVTALLICATCIRATSAAGAFGVDVSVATPASVFTCLHASRNVTYAIVRAYRSLGIPDTACPGSVSAAWEAGLDRVDVYHFPCTSKGAASQMTESLAFLSSHGVKFHTLWLDIERFAWGSNTTANIQFISELAATAQAAGVSVGIYSGRYSWPAITGDTTSFNSFPLWYAHYEVPPNPSFSDYYKEGSYGGWANPTMKQYSGSASECGVTLDLDWRPSM